MENSNEQKGGLFRRLFGMDNDEASASSVTDEQKKDSDVQIKVKSTVYPEPTTSKPQESPKNAVDAEETQKPVFRKLFGIQEENQDSKQVVAKAVKNQTVEPQAEISTTAPTENHKPVFRKLFGLQEAEEEQNQEQSPDIKQVILNTVNKNEIEPPTETSGGPSWEDLLNKIVPPGSEPAMVTSDLPGSTSIAKDVNTKKADSALHNVDLPPWEEEGISEEIVPWDSQKIDAKEDIESQEQVLPQDVNLQSAVVVRLEKAPLKNDQVIWLLQQADEMADNGEIVKAEKMLEVAIALEHHPDVLYALAKHERIAGNMPKAVEYALQSLQEYPDSLEVIDLLFNLAEADQDISLERLVELKPSAGEASAKLGQLSLTLGYLDLAYGFFTSATTLGMNEDEFRFDLGCLYQRMDKHQDAITCYQKCLETGENQECISNLFDVYLQIGSFGDADELATKYFSDSTDPEVRLRVANLSIVIGKQLLEKGEPDVAFEKFMSARLSGSTEGTEWAVKALNILADRILTKDALKAQEWFEKALELGGFEEETVNKLINSYSESGNDEKALLLLENLIQLQPDNVQIKSHLANALQKTGNMTSAVEILEDLAAQGLVNVEVREQLYNYYRSIGDFVLAKVQLAAMYDQKSEKYHSGISALIWEEIRFELEQGEFERAWNTCREELRQNPTPDMLGMGMKVLAQRVDSLASENKVDRALIELEEGRSLGLNVMDLGLREAALYESIGNDLAALNVYESIAENVPEVLNKVKELYLKSATKEYLAGNLAKAIKMLEVAYHKLPMNDEICRALGVLYQETGQFSLAAALLRDAIEETEIQVPTDHLNVLRPHGYRRIRLG